MLDCLAVGLGGFIGSVGRYLMGKIPIKNPTSFPVNTFLIGIYFGCIVALAGKNNNISTRIILFLKVGICGGFTTFSTFSLETSELIKSGDTFTALVYVIASVVLGVFAVILPQCIIR
ncbi:MAG: fluoride efflux transporter FluC [Lachnospiraceae bacterium]